MDDDNLTVAYGGGADGGGTIQYADYLPCVQLERPPDEFDEEMTHQVEDPIRTFMATPFKGDGFRHYCTRCMPQCVSRLTTH